MWDGGPKLGGKWILSLRAGCGYYTEVVMRSRGMVRRVDSGDGGLEGQTDGCI